MTRRIGRYEVLAELGRGGFGHVYRCLDPSLGTPVAIKILTAGGDADMLVRFRNEAATSRRLRHPNIVTIYDFGEQDGVPYIVMELLDGQDLYRVIEARAPLPLFHKIKIMSQIAAALGHAHNEGVIHRDVKPANVMLLRDWTVKMMDFGIALIAQSTHSRLTPRGAVVGTFRYMAPEQFRGSEPDARSDIFSYGLIFYELLSGVHPFHATEAAAVMYNILSVEPVPIGELRPDCPVELRPVLARLLQKDPELRYQSLDDVVFDMEPTLLKLSESRAVELVNDARLAMSEHQLERAQGLIREAVALSPALSSARELRDQLQEQLRRRAVRPKVEDLVKRAREAMVAGNPSEAAQRYESAIRLDPVDPTLKQMLEEAREAAGRLREAKRLLAEAKDAAGSGDAAAAAQFARKAADLAPALENAQEILQQAETRLADEKRRLQLSAGTAHLRRLIEIRSLKEAADFLAELNREFPAHAELQGFADKLSSAIRRDEDEHRLAAGMAAARARFHEGDLSGALSGLEALSVQFPESTDLGSILNAVRMEIEAKRHRDLIARSIEEGRQLAAREQFKAAVEVFDAALAQYPADLELQRERGAAVAAAREAARRSTIQNAIAQARELRSRARFGEAVQLLDSLLASHYDDRAITQLRNSIIEEEKVARRSSEIRDFVRRADELIALGELDTVTRMLESPPDHVRESSEISRLREAAEQQKRLRAERQAALETLVSEVQPLCDRGRFDEALQGVGSFEKRYGTGPEVNEIRNRIRGEQQQEQRSAQELQAQAAALIASDPVRATALLGAAPDRLRGHPEIRRLEEAAQRAAAEQRARDAVAELITRARSWYKEGRPAEALGLIESGLQSYPAQADLSALRAEILAAEARQERERFAGAAASNVRELINSHELENAGRALTEALRSAPDHPELLRLRGELQKARQAEQAEQELQNVLARTRSLLPAQPGPAADLIEPLRRKHPSREDVKAVVEEVRTAAAQMRRRQLADEMERLCEKEDFQGALARVDALEAEAPGEAKRWRERVGAGKEQSERRRAEEAIQAALAIREQKPAQALKNLQALATPIRNRPDVQAAIQESQKAAEAADKRAAMGEIEDLFGRGKLAKARGRYRDAVTRFGTDPAFAQVGARIEAAEREKAAPRAQPQVQPPSRMRWLLAGAVAVAAMVTGTWVLSRRSSQPPAVPMPVEIRTDPDGVSVNVGGHTCLTPNCRLDLPPGLYQIRAERAGYESAQQSLSVEAGKRPDLVSLVLKPNRIVAPAGHPTGTLVVRTGTPDVLVSVDNTPAGRTDANGTFSSSIEAAEHTISAQKLGYDSPRDQRVTVGGNRSVQVAFSLHPQSAQLELRGAPAGVEVRAGGTLLGKTSGSGVFSARVPPGTQPLRITQGADTRETAQLFEPGQTKTLDWNSVAPAVKPVVAPPRPDPSEAQWQAAQAGNDPGPVEAFIHDYPNNAHAAEAQVLLEKLAWQRTGQTDAAALQGYLGKFPNGAHAGDAKARLDDLAWNAVDKTNADGLRTFVQQNPGSLHRQDAQTLLARFEQKSEAADQSAKQSAQHQAQVAAILEAISKFNAAWATKQPADLKKVWPTAKREYLDAMNRPDTTVVLELQRLGDPEITGDTASVRCRSVPTTTYQGKVVPNPKGIRVVRVLLHNGGDGWRITDPFAPSQ
jgi:eukaryotic-like serine/threonine-protein kinase